MGAFFGSFLFGISFVAFGILIFKRHRKVAILEFICGGVFVLAGIVAFALSIPNKQKLKPMSEPVTLNISCFMNKEYKLIVSVETNLPTETAMIATLWDADKTEIIASADGKVENGNAVFSPLSSKNGLGDGEYALDVELLLPFRQNENVRKIIGEHGEYLTGEFAKQSFVETERTVECTKYITINGSPHKSLSEQKKEANEPKENLIKDFSQLYERLLLIKDYSDFGEYSFTPKGNYREWLEELDTIKTNYNYQLQLQTGLDFSDLRSLAFAYAFSEKEKVVKNKKKIDEAMNNLVKEN